MLFIAGRILGKNVELFWNSVFAWVSSRLLWCKESPFKNSYLFPNL